MPSRWSLGTLKNSAAASPIRTMISFSIHSTWAACLPGAMLCSFRLSSSLWMHNLMASSSSRDSSLAIVASARLVASRAASLLSLMASSWNFICFSSSMRRLCSSFVR